MSLEDWAHAIKLLERFADRKRAPLLRDLGVSLCKLHQPHEERFQEGQDYLKHAIELNPDDVDAWASLGGTWRKRERAAQGQKELDDARREAHRCYRAGFEKDPAHPYSLGNYIEYEVAQRPDLDIVSYFRPSLEAATRRCQLQAQVGVNLPWVYFDLGKFQLLLREPYAALGYYAAGVAHSSAAFFLDSALGSFQTLEAARASLPGFDWSREFLRVAKDIRFAVAPVAHSSAASDGPQLERPVVIIAGYCGHPPEAEHRKLLLAAFHGFKGTVISGGTASGISEVVGELQATYGNAVRTLGYVPGKLPPGVTLDPRYEHRHTSGRDFSPLEPLQYWNDLLGAGVSMSEVKLVAIGGGTLTTCECKLALALGVPVAVIDVPGSLVANSLATHPRSTNLLLQQLPPDFGALRAFLKG